MPESRLDAGGAPARRPRFSSPWGFIQRRRQERFERERGELISYLQIATPIALLAERLYRQWREAISEPIQDGQKAANHSAIYWWQVTERWKAYEQLIPPSTASRYHKLFAEALRNASLGTDVAKNGFRSNKFSEVSRGLGFMDRYVEMMRRAEEEMGRLVRKYRLVDE